MDAWRWREWLLLATVLAFSFGHALAGLLVVLVLAVGEVMSGEPLWVATPLDRPLAGVVGIVLISGLASEWRPNAVLAAISIALTASIVLRAVVLASRRRPQFRLELLGVWGAGGALAGAWALARLGPAADARAALPHLAANEFGTVLAVAMVLLAGIVLGGWRPLRAPAAIALAIVAVALTATWSRGAWLGAAVGITLLLAAGTARRIWTVVLTAGLALALAAPLLAPRLGGHAGRLAALMPMDGPFSRVAIWKVAVRIAGDHPVLGTGPATFGFAYQRYRPPGAPEAAPTAHNLLLNAAAETGLPGLVALVVLLAAAIVPMIRWVRMSPVGSAERGLSTTVLAAFGAFMPQQAIDTTVMFLHVAVGFFTLMGLAVADSCAPSAGGRPHAQSPPPPPPGSPEAP